jgi:hypothetical protein
MEELNEFELAILQRLSESNPEIKKHISYLRVRERKMTATSMRINLDYIKGSESLDYIKKMHLSANGYLKMEGLTDGLIDNTIVTNGRIDLIELVTYDEPWDGLIRAFYWDDKM